MVGRHLSHSCPLPPTQVRAGGEDADVAVQENQLDIVRLLVSHGADLNIEDESGTVAHKIVCSIPAGTCICVGQCTIDQCKVGCMYMYVCVCVCVCVCFG